MKSFSTFQEDLRNWFNPNHPDGNWKRVNTKGEVVGDCAREPGEPKPKCMSQSQRDSLSKKEKANAVRRKRKADPNPERQGEPINVTSKVNENMEHLDEKNEPTNPELWARAIAQAKSKFDVYPSAYANGWASKWYKQRGGGWKTVSEAKEKTEYDYEGDMARGQLQSIISNAQRVHDMLEDNDNIAEWVQSKITLAEDYISTVANYMMSEVDEQFNATRHTIEKDSPPSKDKVDSANKQYADMAAARKKKLPQGADFAAQRRKERLASNGRMDEEQHSVLYKMKKDDKEIAVAHYKSKDDAHKFLSSVKTKGGNGIVRTKTNEEVEQVEELSSDLLGRYKTGASKQASELDKAGNIKKADSRFSGIVKATKKQFNNDLKKEASSPAQQAAIAIAMKKDGTVNEVMDEPKYSLSIQARQKKADDANKPPFDGPYKKSTGVVTDKSGAKHGGMSIARNLAKQAMKKQASKMSVKEGLEESRKKAIVREALKDAKERMEKKGKKEEKKDAMGGKGDKFEAEPQMTSLVNDKQ